MNRLVVINRMVAFAVFVFAFSVLPAPSVAYGEVYTGHIVHTLSGRCIMPEHGDARRGHAVILHHEGCRSTGKGNEAWVFEYDAHSRRVKHVQSGLCLLPATYDFLTANGTGVALGDCDEQVTEMVFYRGKYIRHAGGKCIHVGGNSSLIESRRDAPLMLHDGCLGKRAAFTIHGDKPAFHASGNGYKMVHDFSGLCATPKDFKSDRNTRVILSEQGCDVRDGIRNFSLRDNGAIFHGSSGKCIHILGGAFHKPGNNTPLVLNDGCDEERITFQHQRGGVLKHRKSGMCVRPQGANMVPNVGTQLVLHDDCTNSTPNHSIAIRFIQEPH